MDWPRAKDHPHSSFQAICAAGEEIAAALDVRAEKMIVLYAEARPRPAQASPPAATFDFLLASASRERYGHDFDQV